MNGVNGNCGNCGPTSQAQSAQSVETKQLANQIQMQKVMEKVGKGEISQEEGQKQIGALLQEQVQLLQSLAPSAGATSGSGSSTGTAGKGYSGQDTFESSPAGKPMLMLNPSAAPPATAADLDGKGGGSKPSVISG